MSEKRPSFASSFLTPDYTKIKELPISTDSHMHYITAARKYQRMRHHTSFLLSMTAVRHCDRFLNEAAAKLRGTDCF